MPGDTQARKMPEGSLLDPAIRHAIDEVPGDKGFVFTGGVILEDGAQLYALDLDACRSGTGVADWAKRLHETVQSYTETTPSGTGFRIWFAAPPAGRLTRTKVRMPGPPIGTKQPEVQLFGTGSAQYVTVTGNAVGRCRTIRRLDSIDPVLEMLGIERAADRKPPAPLGPDAPPLEAVEAAIRRAPHGAELLAGDWQAALNGSEGDRSASAAFWRLAQLAVRAAHGHRDAALAVLMASPWGLGLIDDSREPDRYTRESWVRKELDRVDDKAPLPVVPFQPVTITEGEPPAVDRPAAPLLQPWADFLAVTGDDPFLLHGWLPRVGLAQVFGAPGCGKTPVALSLAVAVAAGKAEWFGHSIDRTGTVIYMVGEDLSGIRDRGRAEMKQQGLSPEQVKMHVTLRPGRLCDEADVVEWLRAIQAIDPSPAMLVVDTQAANFGPGDENSTADMTRFIAHLQVLTHRLRCLDLLVHHTGWGASDRGRGSSAMFGGLDAELLVSREGRRVTVTSRKEKNWARPEPMTFGLAVHEVRRDGDGRPITAVALGPDDLPFVEQIADELLPVLAAAWHGGSARSIAARAGARKAAGLDAVRRLVELGAIELAPAPAGTNTGGGEWHRLTPAGEQALLDSGKHPFEL